MICVIGSSTSLMAQNRVSIASPDGHLIFSLRLTSEAPEYSVSYRNRVMLDQSPLGIDFAAGGRLASHLKMGKPSSTEIDNEYELVVGKARMVKQHFRQMIIPFAETKVPHRSFRLAVRLFNEGVAFRYEFPEQAGWSDYKMSDELTHFRPTQNPAIRANFWQQFGTSHEALYRTVHYKDLAPENMIDLPALFQFSGKIYMAITEANLRNYAGMYLRKTDGRTLVTQLSPRLDEPAVKVKATLPHQTPWRVIMISDRVGTFLESNMITSLNDPPSSDFSWLRPGKTTFHWWNGDIVPDTTFAPGINFETNKYYIDFAARNGIDYHAVIGYGGFPWYQSNAASYGEIGSETDVTKTVASINMQQICDYAKSMGVGIHVWVHWRAIYPELDKAFSQFQKWGIKGMMVDFMNRDDQEMVNIQEDILKKAAQYHLYIQFHGSFKPTGPHRTYPNELTREGTYNYEQNKWMQQPVSPEHDLDVIMIRMIAGAADYHLGGFRAVPLEKYRIQYTRPLMIGTRCHMLAMYVVLESYLQMVADYPAAYEGQPGFDFLQGVPTTWDETRVIAAELGGYITIARKKGSDWYIGSVTNDTGRSIKIPLQFLDSGSYRAMIFRDAPDAVDHPDGLIREERNVDHDSILQIQLVAGGGLAIKITKK